MALLRRLLRAAELRPYHPLLLFLAAGWVSGVRYLEEKAFIYDTETLRFNELGTLVSWFCFYLALGFGISAILTHAAKIPWQKAAQFASYGLTLAILPPLIDVLIYGRGNFIYRYQQSFFTDTTFLIFNPKGGLPFGEALTVWGSIALVGAVTYIKTQQKFRVVLAAGLMYSFSLIYGMALPGLAQVIINIGEIRSLGDKWILAWTGLSVGLVGFLAWRPVLLRESLTRLPQVVLAPALVLLGGAWAGRINAHTGLAALAFAAASLVFTLTNLFYDRHEDAAQGSQTQVTQDDATSLYAWAWVMAFSLVQTHLFLALSLALFIIATYAYHGDPLRVKCVFPLSYKSEGFFAGSAFLAGMLAQPLYRMSGADGLATFLIFGGFFLSAPFKDAKDIEGDRAAGVHTLYVVLAKRGWTFRKMHTLALSMLAACLLVPVAYLAIHNVATKWIMAPALAALLAVVATLLPQRKLGVGLAVISISAFLLLLMPGLLSLH